MDDFSELLYLIMFTMRLFRLPSSLVRINDLPKSIGYKIIKQCFISENINLLNFHLMIMVQQGLACCIPIKQCMYLVTKRICQSMEYYLVFMAYAMGCFVIPLLGKKKILHLDPPNEKGKLQLDVIFANYFGCNERETGHFKSEAAASL